VRRLREAGVVVRDVALVDPAMVGQTVTAFVGVELDRQREDVLASFERKIAAEPDVQQCYFVSGEIDYLLVVTCRDLDSYNDFRAPRARQRAQHQALPHQLQSRAHQVRDQDQPRGVSARELAQGQVACRVASGPREA
jgi:DNA-binding Lrp family transcriptional regulator